MNTLTIQKLQPSQAAAAYRSLAQAFSADPVSRWLFPEEGTYATDFGDFAAAFAGPAFDNGTATAIEELAGVSLWLAPGVSPDEGALMAALQRCTPPDIQCDVTQMLEQMDDFHPHAPHWYLPLLGVCPSHRGRGLGSLLLEDALDRCDREGLPAYLESSNAANMTLYRRHGFEQIGEIQAGSSPRLYPMLRPAKY